MVLADIRAVMMNTVKEHTVAKTMEDTVHTIKEDMEAITEKEVPVTSH